ncbi:MAG: YdcF family protein [Deltaproteobacteria bacterium]|nr:YdcF family protein [Deltaproteobacteria bacterium]
MDRAGWTSAGISAARAAALFLGGFTAVNLAGGLLEANFDQTIWWVDLRPLPRGAGIALVAVAAAGLLAWALRPAASAWRCRATLGLVATLGLFAAWDAVSFWRLLAAGALASRFPVPLSLAVGGILAGIAWAVLRARGLPPPLRPGVLAGTLAALALGLPLAQMLCFGMTDYRRPADAIVVLGAAVRMDGTPSLALQDRVRTACALFHEGLAPRLLMSGGPGSGGHHEVDVMRALAIEEGIPPDAILLDPGGVNTGATAANLEEFAREEGWGKILAVSHFYHLPRIKMAVSRRGLRVFTVPAQETRVLAKLPYFLLREVAALWAYYLGPLAGLHAPRSGGPTTASPLLFL